jgi:succinate dehydrogenase / fumarate reductase cytochrome b subunit
MPMTTRDRPLSPHLQVYRMWPNMLLSILHRITGAGLSVGLAVLCLWLLALAAGPALYARTQALFGSPAGLVLLLGFLVAFWYHYCAGVRHLIWDTGRGLERPAGRRLRVALLVAVVALVSASLALAWHLLAGAR